MPLSAAILLLSNPEAGSQAALSWLREKGGFRFILRSTVDLSFAHLAIRLQ